MPAEPALTIALSTIGARVAGLAPPPRLPGVVWLVVVQAAPAALGGAGPGGKAARADLRVVPCPTPGIAASRNMALAHAGTPLLLFWDDDMAPNPPGIAALAAEFAADPELDFATGQRAGLARRVRGVRAACSLSRFNIARTATPEIMLRPARFRARGVWFDPGFGLGARHGLGDEAVFLADALRAGLCGRRFGHVTGTHPPRSTGDRWADPALAAARAAVLARLFGPLAPLARAGFAARHRRDLGGTARALAFALGTKRFTRAFGHPT